MAPGAPCIPWDRLAPSKAGPAAVEQQLSFPLCHRAISPLVPMSASRAVLSLAADAACHEGRGNVSAHKGGHAPGQIDRHLCPAGQIQLPGGDTPAEALLYGEGSGGQRGDVCGGEEMEHGGVAGDDHAIDLGNLPACLTAQVLQQGGNALADALGQLLPVPVDRPPHPADNVGPEGALGVGSRGGGQEMLRVIQLGGQGGGAYVHSGAQPGKHGVRSKSLPGALGTDLADGVVCQKADLSVTQHLGTAGQPDTGGQLLGRETFYFCGRGGRQGPRSPYSAFETPALSAAGHIRCVPLMLQDRGEQGPLGYHSGQIARLGLDRQQSHCFTSLPAVPRRSRSRCWRR